MQGEARPPGKLVAVLCSVAGFLRALGQVTSPLFCYLLASLSRQSLLSLAGCILCGFSVGIMWPGTISILSKRIAAGGTALFALLAMAGDLGGAFGPAVIGNVSQLADENIKIGILAGSIFPLILIVAVASLTAKVNREKKKD